MLKKQKLKDVFWDIHTIRRSMLEKMRYHRILRKADLVKEVNAHYFNGCYQVRNEWMVDRSNLVIAVFNGQKSGTKNTIDYAVKHRVTVANVILPIGVRI